MRGARPTVFPAPLFLALIGLLALVPQALAQGFSLTPRAGLERIGPEGLDGQCGTADDFDGDPPGEVDLRGDDGICDTDDDRELFLFGTARRGGRAGCFTNNTANCVGDAGAKSAEWEIRQSSNVTPAECSITTTLTNTSDGEPACPLRGCIADFDCPRLPEFTAAVKAAIAATPPPMGLPPGFSITRTETRDQPCRIVRASYRMQWNPDTEPDPLLVLGGPFDGCLPTGQPGSTLLVPLFEVDLDAPDALTTLTSVNNAGDTTRLARVTLWTDWGVPTLTFHLALSPDDVQTLNLRDVLAGNLPDTSAAGAAAEQPLDCPSATLAPSLDDGQVAQLLADHTGAPNPATGNCAGSDLGDNVARGYLTIDAVEACVLPTTVATYASDDFQPAPVPAPEPRLDGDPNTLWGDFFYVDARSDFAQGEAAVALPRDAERLGRSSYTFYGRFDGFDGADATAPLASTWTTRFLSGGPFDGGTQLVVWRDSPTGLIERPLCGSAPSWFPLGSASVVVFDEDENAFDMPGGLAQLCPGGNTGALAFACPVVAPVPFGAVLLDLAHPDGTPGQAVVTSLISAEGRYSVQQRATPLDDLCGERGLYPQLAGPQPEPRAASGSLHLGSHIQP